MVADGAFLPSLSSTKRAPSMGDLTAASPAKSWQNPTKRAFSFSTDAGDMSTPSICKNVSLPTLLVRRESRGRIGAASSGCSTAASSTTDDSAADLEPMGGSQRALRSSDVAWLLGTITKEQQEYFQHPSFMAECQKRFSALDTDGSGFLDAGELKKALPKLIPTVHSGLLDGGRHILPLITSVPSLISAFDQDSTGYISKDDFPEFMQFCHAWRVRQCVSTRNQSIASASGTPFGKMQASQPSLSQRPLKARESPRAMSAGAVARGTSSSTSRDPSRSLSRPSSAASVSRPLASFSMSRPSSPSRRPSIDGEEGVRSTHLRRNSLAAGLDLSVPGRNQRRPSKPQGDFSSLSGEEYKAAQIKAFEALLKHMAPVGSLADICTLLMQQVVLRSGSAAFTQETIHDMAWMVDHMASRAKIQQASSKENAPSPMQTVSGDPSAQEEVAVKKAGARDPSPPKVTAGSTPSPEMVLQVLTLLAAHVQMPLSDIIGQILWRNRTADPLKKPVYRKLIETPLWMTPDASPEILHKCEIVFRRLSEGGRMKLPQWRKAMELVRKNPVLAPRLRRSDVDRLFYGEVHGASDGLSLGAGNFSSLLMKLAETMNVHPWMIYLAVGCHAQALPSAEIQN